jgi:hypothetical protein
VSGATPHSDGDSEEEENSEDNNDDSNDDDKDGDSNDDDGSLPASKKPKVQQAIPSSSSTITPFHINLVDFNGIHGAKVQYCCCKSGWKSLKAEQLLEAGFFPATPQNPGTAFSFSLLKHYQHHSPVLYQFAEGLRRDTDRALPSDILVRSLLM